MGDNPRAALVKRESLCAALVLALLVLATRLWTFGNPAIHVDDQFYLLVGTRMLHGALPYVDIWDRKPIGLFLIYALAAWAFPDPVIGYQTLAGMAVWLTALVLFVMARRLVSFPSALAGSAVYPAWLALFGGIGGQSPVFYTLPMVVAAHSIMGLIMGRIAREDEAGLTRDGGVAMALVGIAMQIKYTAVFEGLFLGLSLLWMDWRRGPVLPRLAGNAVLWMLCALMPTALAWAFFACHGNGQTFVQANFLSVLADRGQWAPALVRLGIELVALLPFWVCGWLAWRHWQRVAVARWLWLWAGASLCGFLVFGTWFDHYVLPLLAPLGVIAALAFERVRRRRTAMALVIGLGLAMGMPRAFSDMLAFGNARDMAGLAEIVEHHRRGGCLFVADNQPALYRMTGSCLPTRFVFPEHLLLRRFAEALGVDQAAELTRMLDRRPTVIVVPDGIENRGDYATLSLLEARLGRDYRLVGKAPLGDGGDRIFALRR